MVSVVELSGPSARESFARVEPWLQQAMEASFTLLTIHDLWIGCTDTVPTMKLVLIYDDSVLRAAAVLRVLRYSLGSVLEVMAIGGEKMDEWFPEFHERLIEITKNNKCKYMLESGRPGWAKYLKPYGWQDAPRVLYRSVD